jgi:hypothetical protein
MTTGTVMIEQQELMEPGPVRRLQVAPGHTAIWGVDPSTVRLAVAGVEADGRRWVETIPFAGFEGPQRLSQVYEATRAWCSLAWPAHNDGDGYRYPPGLVMVEQPSGKTPNPELLYAVGVILAAIYDGLYLPGAPVRIETVSSAHWKKVACGRGNLYKPTKKVLGRTPQFEDYAVATWARMNGYTGHSWDEADAWGIAEAARREVALVER